MTDHSEDPNAVQDAPLMEQNDRTVDDALDGIVVQTQADLSRSPGLNARELLAQRLDDAGIVLDEGRFEDLLRRASSTSATSDLQPGTDL
ncbi:hypothetical protein [Agromyces aureus]|uniref:Uncharacterized protein n=1 Tax=Agromyces aureus TaxID=453304 RepID=A0A191WFP1_9MICO|nr:hypothetical protein [Agromyces aureus]ANJ27105.1 hypothetical protein ATC03_10570 [Agromyces aureus]